MKSIQFICYTFLFAILFFNSCGCDKKDSFYSKSCGFDCKKIPLIKPYYLGSTTGIDGEWNLSGFSSNEGSIAISSVNVLDSVIISYYFDKYIVVPENRDTTWYINIPSQTQKYRFSSEQEFIKQIAKFTDKRIEFFEVKDLYLKLVKNGYLEWFPEEYKTK
ncbi:MAG: hypothetical protein PHT69_05230 [Bacteroidales bacterium]|nr:hypothetical protein [Bacteroidales bacterium]